MDFSTLIDKLELDPYCLSALGFKSDIDDGIWYDNNATRGRYTFRLEKIIDGSYKVFYGGFDKHFGTTRTVLGLKNIMLANGIKLL